MQAVSSHPCCSTAGPSLPRDGDAMQVRVKVAGILAGWEGVPGRGREGAEMGPAVSFTADPDLEVTLQVRILPGGE